MDIIKKHYEKLVLGFLLLSFVVALIYLLQIMSSTHDTSSGNSAAAKNTLVIQREHQTYQFSSKNETFSLEKQDARWHERQGEGLIGYGRPGLAVPMKSLRCSQCKKILPWAQLRKNEMRCPFEECSQDLSDPGEPEDYEKQLVNFDSDGDGLPDRYEIRLGLNPNSADDANQDKDSDMFSNWFEYYCGSNPDDEKSVPSLDKLLFLTKIEAVKLPIKLSSISTLNPKDKSTYKIFLNIQKRDTTTNVGASFTLHGKRYKIVDAVKRTTTAQGTSTSQQVDDSVIWLQPMDSKNPADRIEVASRKDVYDNKTRKIDIRDVRTPTKRKRFMRDLTVGSTFTIKNRPKDPGGIVFKVADVTEKSAVLEYTVDNKPRKITLELVKFKTSLHERIKKAYVKENTNNNNMNNDSPDGQPQPRRRSFRRR